MNFAPYAHQDIWNTLVQDSNPFNWESVDTCHFEGVHPETDMRVILVWGGGSLRATFGQGCVPEAEVEVSNDNLTVPGLAQLLNAFGGEKPTGCPSLNASLFCGTVGHDLASATIKPDTLNDRPCLMVKDHYMGTLRIPEGGPFWPLWAFVHYAGRR